MSPDESDDDELFERNIGKSTGVGGDDDDADKDREYGAVDAGFEEDQELFDDIEIDESDDNTPEAPSREEIEEKTQQELREEYGDIAYFNVAQEDLEDLRSE